MTDLENVETWLSGLRASSRRLAAEVDGLTESELARPSFAAGWNIADVLSHLGSAAEICTALVERGIAGDATGPQAADTTPVWDRWNALPATEKRAQWRQADRRHLELLESLDDTQRQSVKVPYFAGLLDVGRYAGYRLSEQSMHAWDIEVALDPAATIPADEVDLLWSRLGLVAERFHSTEVLDRVRPASIAFRPTDRERVWRLELAHQVRLTAEPIDDPAAIVSGTAESTLRLFYGRARAQDGIKATGSVALDELQSLFPGF